MIRSETKLSMSWVTECTIPMSIKAWHQITTSGSMVILLKLKISFRNIKLNENKFEISKNHFLFRLSLFFILV